MKNNKISTTQLAKICDVSQGTVDRALHDRGGISPKTKEKVLTAAKAYGYRPNIHARSIAGGKSMLIGVVVFDIANQYFSDILTETEKYCTAKGYSTVVMFTEKNCDREIECIQNLYAMSVDGIILCPINSGCAFENFLLSLELPIAVIGNKLRHFPYIGIDNARAMRETVEYVLRKKYENLIYIKPPLKGDNTFAQSERLQAFYTACAHAKIEFTVTDIQSAPQKLNLHKRNAFICPTDIYAIRLFHTAKQHHAGIIGFDNIRFIDELNLPLDSVAYDIQKAAEIAVDHIIDLKPASHIVPHRLISRGSI